MAMFMKYSGRSGRELDAITLPVNSNVCNGMLSAPVYRQDVGDVFADYSGFASGAWPPFLIVGSETLAENNVVVAHHESMEFDKEAGA
jgi:hypothetical protein